jgi:hypothetical protein
MTAPDTALKLSEVFVGFLRQRPPNEVAWRTMSGNFTAAQIADMIERRNETGLQWASDHARVARDILAARVATNLRHIKEGVSSSFPEPGRIQTKGPCSLIGECDKDAILWRTKERGIAASELKAMVEDGAEEGHRWIQQLLVVSHEMIASNGKRRNKR